MENCLNKKVEFLQFNLIENSLIKCTSHPNHSLFKTVLYPKSNKTLFSFNYFFFLFNVILMRQVSQHLIEYKITYCLLSSQPLTFFQCEEFKKLFASFTEYLPPNDLLLSLLPLLLFNCFLPGLSLSEKDLSRLRQHGQLFLFIFRPHPDPLGVQLDHVFSITQGLLLYFFPLLIDFIRHRNYILRHINVILHYLSYML